MRGWYPGLALCALAFAGCGRGVNDSAAVEARFADRPMAASVQEERKHREAGTLAYEHSVSVQLAPDLIAARMKELQAACARKDSECTLLDVSLHAERSVPSGSVRLRVAPQAVDPLIEVAAKGGEIVARSTHAEDLAEPVADTERQLAMLTAQRARLDEFARSKELKVEQLIAVSKELASVQTQIDELGTQRANLRRRIDTELLSIELSPPFAAYRGEQTPVRDALHSFGSDFLRAIAQVIGFLALLLPWLVVGVPGVILVRMFWRVVGRWLARRETR
ncbi:MAG: DUF4349 domain-containing protein [Steroidobacteraceae bacterium]